MITYVVSDLGRDDGAAVISADVSALAALIGLRSKVIRF